MPTKNNKQRLDEYNKWHNGLIDIATVCGLIGLAALCALFSGCSAVSTQGRAYGQRATAPYFARVQGRSMLPTFKTGDTLLVEKAALSEIQEGDIIVFYIADHGSHFSHRVVGLWKNNRGQTIGLFAKGDNNRTRDPWVITENELVGRVFWP